MNTVKVVDVIHPEITFGRPENIFNGSDMEVRLDGKVLVSIHYVYPWIDNDGQWRLAEKIAKILRGEPLANPLANQPETSGSPMNSSTHSADSAETFGKRDWVWLTDDDRIEIAESMDGGVYGFCKTWGWLNYAKALEAKSKEKNS